MRVVELAERAQLIIFCRVKKVSKPLENLTCSINNNPLEADYFSSRFLLKVDLLILV